LLIGEKVREFEFKTLIDVLIGVALDRAFDLPEENRRIAGAFLAIDQRIGADYDSLEVRSILPERFGEAADVA